MDRARQIARDWVAQAEADYGVACTYESGPEADTATFERPGIDGVVHVTADSFSLNLSLGFLLQAFSAQIEDKVARNVDEMLAKESGESDAA